MSIMNKKSSFYIFDFEKRAIDNPENFLNKLFERSHEDITNTDKISCYSYSSFNDPYDANYILANNIAVFGFREDTKNLSKHRVKKLKDQKMAEWEKSNGGAPQKNEKKEIVAEMMDEVYRELAVGIRPHEKLTEVLIDFANGLLYIERKNLGVALSIVNLFEVDTDGEYPLNSRIFSPFSEDYLENREVESANSNLFDWLYKVTNRNASQNSIEGEDPYLSSKISMREGKSTKITITGNVEKYYKIYDSLDIVDRKIDEVTISKTFPGDEKLTYGLGSKDFGIKGLYFSGSLFHKDEPISMALDKANEFKAFKKHLEDLAVEFEKTAA
jgi:hypothetical protein